MFVDQAEVWVEAGAGGAGAATFRREKFVPRGGPSGGDGGSGGSIILEADPGLSTLLDFRYSRQYRADRGQDGQAKKRAGASGKDLVLRVPEGTLVTDADTGEAVADLIEPGQRFVVARGGAGGRGNLHFASSVRQAPRFAELGEPGQSRRLRLDLKLVADVGVVGFPSVGKSTLIAAASAARPKIAEYPFTTLTPNLGLVCIGPSESFVLADMPGLVEGAHTGAGIGDRFLRHIERTRVLIHMLDVSGLTERSPLADFRAVNWEMALHSPDLASRPQIVALNKTDLVADADRCSRIASELERDGWEVHKVSAATHAGVRELLRAVWQRLRSLDTAAERPEAGAVARGAVPNEASAACPAGHMVFRGPERTREREWKVAREADGAWAVFGRSLERLVRRTDLSNDQAVARLQHALEKAGVHRKLREMGACQDDTVRIGEAEFVFDDEDLERVRHRRRRRKGEPD
jgi:GTP-binding protein